MGRASASNPHAIFIAVSDTLPMQQKHYTFFTAFFLIALLMLTSAAWHAYVTGTPEPESSGRLLGIRF